MENINDLTKDELICSMCDLYGVGYDEMDDLTKKEIIDNELTNEMIAEILEYRK